MTELFKTWCVYKRQIKIKNHAFHKSKRVFSLDWQSVLLCLVADIISRALPKLIDCNEWAARSLISLILPCTFSWLQSIGLRYSTANSGFFEAIVALTACIVPPFIPVWMTMVAKERPACNRSLATNPYVPQLWPTGYSLSSNPLLATICFASSRLSLGYIESQSSPLARKAIVMPLACKAPLWPVVSHPIARPETIL